MHLALDPNDFLQISPFPQKKSGAQGVVAFTVALLVVVG